MSAGKSAALVVGGALIGAGVATLVLKKKYEAQAEADIESVRESYISRIQDLESILDKHESKSDPVVVTKTAELPKERVAPTNEALRTAYHKIKNNPETVEGLAEVVENLGYSRKEEPVKNERPPYEYLDEDKDINVPYVIPVNAYMDDEEMYFQTTLMYYAGDKTLVNEAEEVIEDVRGTVGDNIDSKFGQESGNSDTVYIRNDRIKSEYEVLRSNESYSTSVLGIDTWDDTPEPRQPIKKFR